MWSRVANLSQKQLLVLLGGSIFVVLGLWIYPVYETIPYYEARISLLNQEITTLERMQQYLDSHKQAAPQTTQRLFEHQKLQKSRTPTQIREDVAKMARDSGITLEKIQDISVPMTQGLKAVEFQIETQGAYNHTFRFIELLGGQSSPPLIREMHLLSDQARHPNPLLTGTFRLLYFWVE